VSLGTHEAQNEYKTEMSLSIHYSLFGFPVEKSQANVFCSGYSGYSAWICLLISINLLFFKQPVLVLINLILISINFENKGKHETENEGKNHFMENPV
jgi:hypothetical protein